MRNMKELIKRVNKDHKLIDYKLNKDEFKTYGFNDIKEKEELLEIIFNDSGISLFKESNKYTIGELNSIINYYMKLNFKGI